MLGILAAPSIDDFWQMAKDTPPDQSEMLKFLAMIVTDSDSPGELEYKENLFQKAIERHNGFDFPLEPELAGPLFRIMVSGQGQQRVFNAATGFLTAALNQESWDAAKLLAQRAAEELYAKAEAEGKISYTGESPWFAAIGDSWAHTESVVNYDQFDPESIKAVKDILAEADIKLPQWRIAVGGAEGCLSFDEASEKAAAPYCMDFLGYEKQIKKAFDPNLLAESSFYVNP